MNLNTIALIGNEHLFVLEKLDAKPAAIVSGVHTAKDIQSALSPIFRIQNLDIVIFDATAVSEDFLETVRFIKASLHQTTRLIVLYPNLEDEAILQQLYVYGVYDVVRSKIDKETMDDIAINNQILADLQWVISEPTKFANIADKLSISVISETIIKEHYSEIENDENNKEVSKKVKAEKPKKEMLKPRLIGFYGETDEMLRKIESSNKYNVVDIIEAKEENVTNVDFSSIDIVVLDKLPEETIAYVKSLVDANQYKSIIIAAEGSLIDVQMVDGVKYFAYSSAEEFSRQISINSIRHNQDVKPTSRVYAIYGTKGGCGSTTLTAILAKEYAKLNPDERVIAVDFGLRAGDLGSKFGIALDADHFGNLFACVSSFLKAKTEHNDLNLLKGKVVDYCHFDKHSGVYVLPTSYTDIYRYLNFDVSSEDIAFVMNYILETLKEQFDAVFVDVTKFGGYPFDVAVDIADKYILVSEAKLTGISQLLNKYEELKENKLTDKMAVVINKSDIKHNENEYDNSKILEERIDKNRVVYVPFDKVLFEEPNEMSVTYSKSIKKIIPNIYKAIDYFPKPKKKLFSK